MTVIKVENLGKRYLIGHDKKAKGAFRYNSMRDSIAHSIRGIYQRIRHPLSPNRENTELEEFWALKDINLEIKQGERIGIIGHNGAGKTTLLKLLSRITHPTTGSIKIKGRIASLLEVGTGFHPELSGRENIYLNGAILGMKRNDIKKKFDQIVEFAEVEKFLDTPVKRYSSGMYVRLAFAIAAHLEPDILLVDEVLSVGDAAFQKKSLGKMKEVSGEGRTVLFVSHNMAAIEQLCSQAILLNNGKIENKSNDVNSIIRQYLYRNKEKQNVTKWRNLNNEYENPYFDLHGFYIVDTFGNPIQLPIKNNSEIFVYVKGFLKKTHPAFSVGYAIYTDSNIRIYSTLTTDSHKHIPNELTKGNIIFKSKIPKHFLNEGGYRISLIVGIRTQAWFIHPNQSSPNICLEIQGGLSDSIYWTKRRPGVIAPFMQWQVEYA